MKEVGRAVLVRAEPAGRHGDDNGYAGSADVNNIENKLFETALF